ncbi:uncharacterized protein CDAR_243691 [Caerostris darwini]|uniref:Uncharacterized protein n=1 Tax=Caerostris darwini TaxID=1538125 RepID=A0AAV4VCE4_9ARAC|nr:uncharacterized protein CDAR_243691 [Caerostris darwini]
MRNFRRREPPLPTARGKKRVQKFILYCSHSVFGAAPAPAEMGEHERVAWRESIHLKRHEDDTQFHGTYSKRKLVSRTMRCRHRAEERLLALRSGSEGLDDGFFFPCACLWFSRRPFFFFLEAQVNRSVFVHRLLSFRRRRPSPSLLTQRSSCRNRALAFAYCSVIDLDWTRNFIRFGEIITCLPHMSMEDRTTQSDHNDKENPVSSSPDSGLCDLDTPPEDPPPESSKPRNSSEGRFRYGQTFDPFFFRYGPDNRKLTLLKSLSQDSEYSLDTSLFDAEEFLQDMGFAGTTDPTIPERFLPSLMQRLSRFPESEMEGLHHRIIQSIGCFRRKEGKRRLFRNLSMGKDSRTDPKHLLSCPSGNYPLLRSNTGPAEFPFNESTASAYETAGDSLKSGRLSSSDSGHHSMDSLKNEDEFPESPIAILVSAASVEQDEKSLEDEDSEGEDDASTLKQISDGEFVSTVQEIQKLTDEISDSDDAVSLMTKEGFEAAESSELGVEKKDGEDSKTAEDEFCIIENLPESVKGSCDDDKVQTVELGCEERSVLSDNNVKSPMKRPLRRISNAINYNPLRHSKRFGSMELQNSINENDDRMNCEAQEPNPVFRDPFSENNTNPFKNSECNAILDRASENRNTLESTPKSNSALNPFSSESVNSKVSISDSVDVFTNAPTLSHSFQFSSNATLSSSQADSSQFCTSVNTSDIEPRGRNSKPKFTRDDSLTNFLSSMLDMTESDSILKPPATPPPPHLKHEKQSKSDSEILQDNFSSEKFSMQYSVHKARSSESLNKVKSFSSYVQDKSAEVKSIAKSPTRKRRVLHRMSSSLQCCDDENCEDVDRFNVPEEFKFPPTNPFASVEIPPKPALRATQSNLSRTPGHRPVHPCSSLPAIKSCSSCETQNELGCAARWWNGQSSSDPEESRLHNRRRERRNCKKRRYLSCPSPEAKFNFNPWMNVRLFSGTCGAEMNRCQYLSESGLVPEIRGFPSRLVDHSEMRFSERHSGWDNCVCYKDCTCVNCHNFPDAHFQRSRIAVLPALPSRRNSRRCTWNSTPDVRCAHWNSFPKEYFAKPPVNSLSDPSVMRSGNLGAPSSFYEEAHFSHEIERTDCSCFLDPPDNAQTQRNKRLRVRTPQRQNSMSIDDPDEESLPNWNVVRHDNPCQDSIPNRNGYFLDSRHPDVPPPFNASRKSGAVAPTQNISDPNSRREKVSLRREVVSDKIHRLSSATSNIKNEAMMERKIRIFSKFFTNLGNLSKSIQDKNFDTKKQKEGAVSGSDKPLQWDTRRPFLLRIPVSHPHRRWNLFSRRDLATPRIPKRATMSPDVVRN